MTMIDPSAFEAGALAALNYITDEREDLEDLTMRVAEKIGADVLALNVSEPLSLLAQEYLEGSMYEDAKPPEARTLKAFCNEVAELRPYHLPSIFLGCAIANEAGEVAGEIKKEERDALALEYGEITDSEVVIRDAQIKEELGDNLFYWARICQTRGYDPDEIMANQLAKVRKRMGGKYI